MWHPCGFCALLMTRNHWQREKVWKLSQQKKNIGLISPFSSFLFCLKKLFLIRYHSLYNFFYSEQISGCDLLCLFTGIWKFHSVFKCIITFNYFFILVLPCLSCWKKILVNLQISDSVALWHQRLSLFKCFQPFYGNHKYSWTLNSLVSCAHKPSDPDLMNSRHDFLIKPRM